VKSHWSLKELIQLLQLIEKKLGIKFIKNGINELTEDNEEEK
jgi:hypothetical protein